MSDNPQNKAKSTDHVEDKALEKSSTNPETAKESQTDAKGQQKLELQRTNKHDGSAGFNDKGDIESVRIETIDEYGNKKVASRKHGGSEKDLLPSSRPAGGFGEVHNADGSVILKGVIPGPGEELENITTGTMEALASENELVKNALEMRKQIDQHMEPGAEKDKVVSQLKTDVTASLMSSEISENEIGGTHKAITLESSQNLDTSRDISEKLQETSSISPERMQAVENATAFLVAETARLHGKDKVDALDIDKSDVGRALGTYLLTPDVANAVGEADTRKFGQMLMVFGLAPSFGLADEAQKQITEKTQETVHDGSANFLTGTAFGAILEGHPAVALSIGAVMTTTFFHDQLFSPENKARNEEVLDLYSKTGNSGPEELIAFCDKSKELLGPEAYKASFDLATGGIGIPHGPAASRGIKTEAGSIDLGALTKNVTDRLKQLPDQAMRFINEIVGHDSQGLKPALAGEAGVLSSNVEPTRIEDISFKMEEDPRKRAWKSEDEEISFHRRLADEFPSKLIGEIEKPADVAKQIEDYTCVSACGEMLTDRKTNQKSIYGQLQEYLPNFMRGGENDVKHLADWLGKGWQYEEVLSGTEADIKDILKRGEFCTEFRALGEGAHAVVVDSIDDSNLLTIRDPGRYSKYKMHLKDFMHYWSGRVVSRSD